MQVLSFSFECGFSAAQNGVQIAVEIGIGLCLTCVFCLILLHCAHDRFGGIMNVRRGDIYGFIGKNGADKTALTSIVLSLVYGAVFTSVGVIVSNRQTV